MFLLNVLNNACIHQSCNAHALHQLIGITFCNICASDSQFLKIHTCHVIGCVLSLFYLQSLPFNFHAWWVQVILPIFSCCSNIQACNISYSKHKTKYNCSKRPIIKNNSGPMPKYWRHLCLSDINFNWLCILKLNYAY